MNKISKFLEEASFIKTLITLSIVLTILSYIFIYGIFSNAIELKFFELRTLYISIASGILFGFIFSYTFLEAKKNDRFWRYSEVVYGLISKAETKEELKKVYENEFVELKKMSLGGAHNYELRRLYTIMNTKVDYLK